MGGKRVRAYWDTCILLALLKREKRENPLDMQGVYHQARMCDEGQVEVITSVHTLVETHDSTLPDEGRKQLVNLRRHPHFMLAETTVRIAEIAREICDHYRREDPEGLRVTSSDSIHLATAILYKCDVFYTFDGCGKKPRRSRPLLPMSGNVANKYTLRIEKPPTDPSGQFSMEGLAE
ncbi:MAG: PIN domain-containing protein [Armatimonadetes bacterium]|nr:PIN domain-containing protein [Armatimonadota bacterium]